MTRELAQRQTDRQTDIDMDVTNVGSIHLIENDSLRIGSREPGINKTPKEGTPPNDGSDPKTHSELYVKGKKVKN